MVEFFNSGKDSALKVWTKRIQKELKIQNKEYNNVTIVSLNYIDCRTNKFSISSGTYYDQEGVLIGSYDDGKNLPNKEAVPESVYEKLIELVCKFYYK